MRHAQAASRRLRGGQLLAIPGCRPRARRAVGKHAPSRASRHDYEGHHARGETRSRAQACHSARFFATRLRPSISSMAAISRACENSSAMSDWRRRRFTCTACRDSPRASRARWIAARRTSFPSRRRRRTPSRLFRLRRETSHFSPQSKLEIYASKTHSRCRRHHRRIHRPETGEKKKQRINVGVVFTNDEGRMSLKLNAIPVVPGWSGFVSFFPILENEDRPPRREFSRAPSPTAKHEPEDDDIPF